MNQQKKTQVIIAHYGLDRKITREECEMTINQEADNVIFIDFEAGYAKLGELYELPFENIALTQQRKFSEILKPVLDNHPAAHIAYFGLTPISVGFHLGYLVGNTHSYTIYQWHHADQKWFSRTNAPSCQYVFGLAPITLPKEIQKGKGNVTIRVATSFNIDPQSTYEVAPNPANEFDIEILNPHIDSLFTQENIQVVVNTFQEVLNCYASQLTDREQIHLFISSSGGLPFALGTRVNTNMYPYIQTYQYDRKQSPKHRAAILITKEVNDRIILTEADKKDADTIRTQWEDQLQNKLKPFIEAVTGNLGDTWLKTICKNPAEYATIETHHRSPWNSIITIGETTLKEDRIDLAVKNIDDGFEYIEKNNSWLLDDGFLSGLKKRLDKCPATDIMQAGRLFFFHEALHYSGKGHRLTREIANGIGQFPKVIEEADYQADVWGLLTEYRYCCMYESTKLKTGLKDFFCNAIDTAVETMWSFVDTGTESKSIQVRSMNRFLNWYWQWTLIEALPGTGTIKEIIEILLHKPVIEFAGMQMELRAHRTFFKLNGRPLSNLQLAAFAGNRVHRFAPTCIDDIVSGFKQLNGGKIKNALKSFQVTIN